MAARKHKQNPDTKSKGFFIALEASELSRLNKRLRSYGYITLDALIKDFASGSFPDTTRTAVTDPDYLKVKIRKLMALSGGVGLAIKVALLAGLRAEELAYAYNSEICQLSDCQCRKLHVVNLKNGLSIVIVNWIRGHKRCYFAILPSRLWESFRSQTSFDSGDIANAAKVAKQSTGVNFEQLKTIYWIVMRQTMDKEELRVLVGTGTYEEAKDCLAYKISSMAARYYQGWEKAGIILPVI